MTNTKTTKRKLENIIKNNVQNGIEVVTFTIVCYDNNTQNSECYNFKKIDEVVELYTTSKKKGKVTCLWANIFKLNWDNQYQFERDILI